MLNGVDVAYVDWKLILGNQWDSSLWILEHFYDDVEEWLEEAYGEEGMSFDEFCHWVRFKSKDFAAEFPRAWKSLYEKGLLDAEDCINMVRFQGDEDQLVELATEANPQLGEEVRQKLIEEDRLEESYCSCSRKNSLRRRLTESRRRQISHRYPRSRR